MTDLGQNLRKLFFRERNQGKTGEKSKKSRGISREEARVSTE